MSLTENSLLTSSILCKVKNLNKYNSQIKIKIKYIKEIKKDVNYYCIDLIICFMIG